MALVVVLSVGCGPGDPGVSDVSSVADVAIKPSPMGPDLDVAQRAAALETLTKMKHRPSCNRISGCPGATALMQHRRAVVPFLLEQLAAEPVSDGYWVYALVDLLGQLDDARARPLLETLLEDRRWAIDARAALALGRLRLLASQPALQAAHQRAVIGKDLTLHAMTAYALARLRPSERARFHGEIAELLPTRQEALFEIPPIILDVLIEAVREAQVTSALPAVRLAALNENRFVRAQAIDTLAALRDTGGLPYAYANLSHALPSIRRRALHALQTITGSTSLVDAASWKAWCEQHACTTIPARGP